MVPWESTEKPPILMLEECSSGEELISLKKSPIMSNMMSTPSKKWISLNLMFKLELKHIGLFGMKINLKKLMI